VATDNFIPRYYYGANEDRGYREHMTCCAHVAQTIEKTVASNTDRQIAINNASITGLTNHGRQTLELLSPGFQTTSWEFGKIQSGFVQGLNRLNDTFFQVSQDICGELDKINNNLNDPLWIQSRDLYDRALLNYTRGFCEEAVEDLIRVLEINKADYMSWFLLGRAYLFGAGEFSCAIDLDAAICAFANAAKYIAQDIAKHARLRQTAAEILFHLGLSQQTKAKDLAFKQKTKENTTLATEARRAYDQSWAYYNEMLESLYNSARYDVILGDGKMALNKLQTVIQGDPRYAEELMYDPDFAPLHDDIARMIGVMRKKIASELLKLKKELEPQYESLPSKFVAILDKIPDEEPLETPSSFDERNMLGYSLRIRNEIFAFYQCIDAFRDCSELTSITIPEGVTVIGEGAFAGCSSLTWIVIPQGVTSIGERAFAGCFSLVSVVIPWGITDIGKNAFSNCSSLVSIILPQGVTGIGDYTFFDCASLISTTIPPSVVGIGKNAFSNCSTLTQVVIPEGVTGIGEGAFFGCASLTSIVIPPSITCIGEGAFAGCPSLTSVVIPKGVTCIERDTFKGCSSLASVVIPESVSNIEMNAFLGCSSLTSVIIPQGVTYIGDGSFFGCASLASVVICEGVTNIGKNAFNYCSSLTSVAIPQGVTSIGEWAFHGCSSLASVVIPTSVASIGKCAFLGCEDLSDEFRKAIGEKWGDGVL